MDLYLLRHGPAGDAGGWDGDDHERPLTTRGIRRTRRVLESLDHLGLRPRRIVSSPYRRALQTAELAGRRFGLPVARSSALRPGTGPATAARWLAAAGGRDAVLLVGHEPGLTRLAAWLLGGTPAPRLRLRKAGLLHLGVDMMAAGGATLRRLLDPDDLEHMRRAGR